MLLQRTIKNPIKAVGVGLHSGKDMILELLPAQVNSGITFVRNDLDPEIEIPAIFEYVGDTTLSTALFKEGYKIGTVEHLLSAIAGLGIDNCVIKVDGPEKIYIFGSYAENINECIEHPKKIIVNSLDDALNQIFENTRPNNILFSPGYPSGNDFKNYSERGKYFNLKLEKYLSK